MRVEEVPHLIQFLSARFAQFDGASVGLSGSFARGDFRVSESGVVLSDVDLIPVIRDPHDAPIMRVMVQEIVDATAVRFDIKCTASITLVDAIARNRHLAGYATSMFARPLLVDSLGIADGGTPEVAPSPALRLAWRCQPVTYYLAKSHCASEVQNISKAFAALAQVCSDARCMVCSSVAEGRGQRSQVAELLSRDTCIEHFAHLVREAGIGLLDSSRRYLEMSAAKVEGLAVFASVRDSVFLENQGLPFDVAYVFAARGGKAESGLT